VALLPDACSVAMRDAAAAALGDVVPRGDTWWLVDGPEELVVPLCAALPDGVSLALRTSSGRLSSSSRGGGSSSGGGGGGAPSLSGARSSSLLALGAAASSGPLTTTTTKPTTALGGVRPGGNDDDYDDAPRESSPRTLLRHRSAAPPKPSASAPQLSPRCTAPPEIVSQPPRPETATVAAAAAAKPPRSPASGTSFGLATASLRRSFVELRDAVGLTGSPVLREAGAVERSMVDVKRMSRVATELANERTLLAWARTALAAERTVFSFLGYKATISQSHVWQHVYYASTAILATIAVVLGLVGVDRYNKIKRALTKRDPPKYFNRVSLQPSMLVIGVVMSVLTVSVYAHVLAKV